MSAGQQMARGEGRRFARDCATTWRRDSWVRPYLRRYRKVLVEALGLGFGSATAAAALMFFCGDLISCAAEMPGSVFDLFTLLGAVQLCAVAEPLLRYFGRLESHDWVFRMTSDLRRRLWAALAPGSGLAAGHRRAGEALGMLTEDIGHVQNLYLRSVFPIIIAWALWIAVTVLFGAFSWAFALFALVAMGVAAVIAPLLGVLTDGAREARAKGLRADAYTQLTDSVLGMADLGLAGRTGDAIGQVEWACGQVRAEETVLKGHGRKRDLVTQMVLGLFALAMLAWASARFGGGSSGLADLVAAFALLFFPLAEVLAPVSGEALELAAQTSSVRRLNALRVDDKNEGSVADITKAARSDEEAGSSDAPGDISRVAAQAVSAHPTPVRTAPAPPAAESFGAASPGDAPRVRRTIEPDELHDVPHSNTAKSPGADIVLDGVRFTYPQQTDETIRGISLEVPAGGHIAVLGRSGSGKSTLLALMRGDLTPTTGSVLCGGVEASLLGDGASMLMGVIQQDTYLFNMTLYDNLCIGKPEATRDEALETLEKVGLEALAKRLPLGLDTMVDEGGMRFSGGERRRIAIARVLLQNTPIVLLDEPTVGLDPLTEAALLDTLHETLAGRTVIMVTHHLQGVSRMDSVIFIDDGRVALQGAPALLAKKSERYRRLLAFDQGDGEGSGADCIS